MGVDRDLKYQKQATEIYQAILKLFSNDDYRKYQHNVGNPDLQVYNLESFTHRPFFIVLGPKNDELQGGFGFLNNDRSKPWIMVNIMEPNIDLYSELKSSRVKEIIIHEIIHHIDQIRFSPTYKQSYSMNDLSLEKYYNSPEEMNTHYHQIISFIQDMSVSALKSLIAYRTVNQTVNDLYDSVLAGPINI